VSIDKIDIKVIELTENWSYFSEKVYLAEIKYSYEVSGVEYRSKKIALSQGLKFRKSDAAIDFCNNFAGQTECFVSMKKPNRSFLVRQFSIGSSHSQFSYLATSILIFGVYLGLSYIS